MKDRYLFKAKRISDGKWVEGSLVMVGVDKYVVNDSYFRLDGHHIACDSDTPVFIDETTICQYTGLTDKNGNKIWENDVVRLDEDIYIVTWEEADAMFALEDVGVIEHFGNADSKWCEVICNIFDNPELLGG